jgi:hypothetical protein
MVEQAVTVDWMDKLRMIDLRLILETHRLKALDAIQHRIRQREKLEREKSLFDLKLRTFSEMCLCPALDSLPVPQGFNKLNGYVVVDNIIQANESEDNEPDIISHSFYNNKGIVACLFPGQFIEIDPVQKSLDPGDRLQIIGAKAPNLIHYISRPEGIAVLVGPSVEIKKRLGLSYYVIKEGRLMIV